MVMLKTKPQIGPQDLGRRMALKQFEPAQVQNGYLYELARGIVVVSEGPGFSHLRQVSAIRRPLMKYQDQHPERIYEILGTMECKLLLWDLESERHPDLAVYLSPPPVKKGRQLWTRWLPELVVEVVSRSSVDRDYVEKREEYWRLGVKEYWIVDAKRMQVMILRRGRSQWIAKARRGGEVLETKLLPGFQLPCNDIFEAAGAEEAD
jgi:Uma2 family endonuclease